MAVVLYIYIYINVYICIYKYMWIYIYFNIYICVALQLSILTLLQLRIGYVIMLPFLFVCMPTASLATLLAILPLCCTHTNKRLFVSTFNTLRKNMHYKILFNISHWAVVRKYRHTPKPSKIWNWRELNPPLYRILEWISVWIIGDRIDRITYIDR